MIEFSDGVVMDAEGGLRVSEKDGVWYVVGQGLLLPTDSEEEAKALLWYIDSSGMFVDIKMFKSSGRRQRVLEDYARAMAEGTGPAVKASDSESHHA